MEDKIELIEISPCVIVGDIAWASYEAMSRRVLMTRAQYEQAYQTEPKPISTEAK